MTAGVVLGRRPRRRLPAWAIVLLVIAGVLLIPIVWIVVDITYFVVAFSLSFTPPNVDAAVSHVRSMPCVTWARSFTDGGGIDVRKSAIIQVGLRPECTAAQIDATYASLYAKTAAVRDYADAKMDYLVMPSPPRSKPGSVYETTRSSGAQLTVGRNYDLPSPSAFAGAVDDWMTVRLQVDPRAQLQLLDTDLYTEAGMRFVANSTADDLRALSTALPERLRSQAAWKITIPAHDGPAFAKEDDAPVGGVTFETSEGLPDAWLLDFGRALNGAWPDKGDGEYVYVFRPSPLGFNEVSARVFGVDPVQAFPGGRPAAPDTTTAWPALTGAVDALSAEDDNRTFSIGVALYGRPFARGDTHPDSGNSVTIDSTLAVFTSDRCANPDPDAPDGGVIADALCRYWTAKPAP